jgi:hypothetical protein
MGQWIFACYIAFFFGGSAVRGDFQSWNKSLAHGYIVGNTVLAVHPLFAATISLSGALQLVPRIQAWFPRFHRWNGRIYVPIVLTMGMNGLYLLLSGRRVVGDTISHVAIAMVAIAMNGVLIIAFAGWRGATRLFAISRPIVGGPNIASSSSTTRPASGRRPGAAMRLCMLGLHWLEVIKRQCRSGLQRLDRDVAAYLPNDRQAQ